MSRQTHQVNRSGNTIDVFIYDGRSNTARKAEELARRACEPWEITWPARREQSDFWVVEVDTLRSARRKAVVDMVIESMDETDRPVRPAASVEDYLAELREYLELQAELLP